MLTLTCCCAAQTPLLFGGCAKSSNAGTFPRSVCEIDGVKEQKVGDRIPVASPTRMVSTAPVGGAEDDRIMDTRMPGASFAGERARDQVVSLPPPGSLHELRHRQPVVELIAFCSCVCAILLQSPRWV